jgi:H+/Cl- antiporter ClcA
VASFKNKLKWLLYSALGGALSGCASSLFLYLLNKATSFRSTHHHLIFFLPLAGFLIGWAYHQYGKGLESGNNLVIDEIHDPKKTLPFKMAPLILVSTVLTHLFGGSAGREGTVVQMGASISDQISQFYKANPENRKRLLAAGAGAGFGSALGTPFAGVIFGMEMIYASTLPKFSQAFAWLECLVASFSAYFITQLLKTSHTLYPTVEIPHFDFKIILFLALAGLLFGRVARFFSLITHFISNQSTKWIKYNPLKPLIGGTLLVLLYWLEGSYRYEGLGLHIIQEAFILPAYIRDVAFKILFTAITLGFGFKGGEFVPLVFIGTLLGSFLALHFHLPVSFLAGLGFAAVFGGAAKTPLACTVMAMELFGTGIGPAALFVCMISSFCSGKLGIYKSQK